MSEQTVDELVKELRDAPYLAGDLCNKAAAALTRLQGENQLLKADLDICMADSNRASQIIYDMSSALNPNAGEHNIDCAIRVAKERDTLLAENQVLKRDRDRLDYAILYPRKFMHLMEVRAHGGFSEQELQQGREAIDFATTKKK